MQEIRELNNDELDVVSGGTPKTGVVVNSVGTTITTVATPQGTLVMYTTKSGESGAEWTPK